MIRYISFIILLYIITNNANASCTCPAHLTTERINGNKYETDDLAGMLRYLGETCNSCRTAGVNVYAETTCSEPYDVPYDVWESSGGNNYLVTKYKKVTDIKLATVKCICEQPNKIFPMPEGNYTELGITMDSCVDDDIDKANECTQAGGYMHEKETKKCCTISTCIKMNDDTNTTDDPCVNTPYPEYNASVDICQNPNCPWHFTCFRSIDKIPSGFVNSYALTDCNGKAVSDVYEKDEACKCTENELDTSGKVCSDCPYGQVYLAGLGCVDKEDENITCANGEVYKSGLGCVAPSPDDNTTCPDGEVYVAGLGCVAPSPDDNSTCSDGEVYIAGVGCAVATPDENTTCPFGQVYIRGLGCATPSPDNNDTNITKLCPSNSHWSFETDSCVPDFDDVNNTDNNGTGGEGEGEGQGEDNNGTGGGEDNNGTGGYNSKDFDKGVSDVSDGVDGLTKSYGDMFASMKAIINGTAVPNMKASGSCTSLSVGLSFGTVDLKKGVDMVMPIARTIVLLILNIFFSVILIKLAIFAFADATKRAQSLLNF